MKLTENLKEGQAVKLIPLGGLNEIGKNLTVLEYKNDILIIDCGLSFPDDEMFGIDIVIPDFDYLEKNREKLKGMILTHGHEDHIGAIPYLLKTVDLPIYGTKLTLELVGNKLKEHGIKARLNPVKAGQTVKIGEFKVETIRTTHSIADSICLAIDTPAGVIFHTGDFKIDYTPLHGEPIDFQRLAKIGEKGVLLMLADSTNAERKGYTPSERNVGIALENIFRNCSTRILIATFSSNVHRVQKIIDTAVIFNRKVAISGRSMINVVNIAKDIGYLKIPDNVLVDINKAKSIKDSELVIITTGSQGEPMSALARMAANDHKAVQIKKGDVVILSSTPVPGNEKTVSNVVNRLFERGAEVIYSDIADIHVSGHAAEEELKLIHSLIRPKYFLPVHGEYRHLRRHASIAETLGMAKENIFILTNGEILSLKKNQVEKIKETIQCNPVFVDGLGVGDVGNIVLRDRKLLSESGLIIVVAAIDKATGTLCSGPDIISRGFVYVRESEDLIEAARKVAEDSLNRCRHEGIKDWGAMKNHVRNDLQAYIYQLTKRNPVILPIFMEV
ncbi:MAG TPA: ribonuclease J [Bacillota bacterium]|nr:ribonuclease J [Bacillota bacterium]